MSTLAKISTFDDWLVWNKSLEAQARALVSSSGDSVTLPIQLSHRIRANTIWTDSYHGSYVFGAGKGLADTGHYTQPIDSAGRILVESPKQNWWLAREAQRFMLELKTPIPAGLLGKLMGAGLKFPAPLPWHFASVSKEPGCVDFYFTVEDGQRDKMTTMAFGRYIAKFLPFLSNAAIQYLESQFRILTSDAFDVFMGGENIVKYYLNGPHSCMVLREHHYQTHEHPLMTYDAPGWGIAILAADEAKTKASARSLVWINPEDDKVKHYIRVYGDPVLESRLKKAGFTNEIPVRAPLKYVPAKNRPGYIYLPYFDSTNSNVNGDGGYVFMNKDRPVMLRRQTWEQMRLQSAFGPYLIRHAHATLEVRDQRWVGNTCSMCGKKDLVSFELDMDSVVCPDCVATNQLVKCSGVDVRTGYQVSRLLRADQVLVFRGTAYEKSKRSFELYGIVQLDPLFYGEDAYEHKSLCFIHSGSNWKASDTVMIFTKAGKELQQIPRNMHDNGLDLEALIPLVSVPGHGTTRFFADKSTKHLVRKSTASKNIIPYHLHKSHVRYAAREMFSVVNGYSRTSRIFSIKLIGSFREAALSQLTEDEIDICARAVLTNAKTFEEAWGARTRSFWYIVRDTGLAYANSADELKRFIDAPCDEVFTKSRAKALEGAHGDDALNMVANIQATWRRIRARWYELFGKTEAKESAELSTAD